MGTPKIIYLRLKSKFKLSSPEVLEETLKTLPEYSTVTIDGSNTEEFDKEALSFLHKFRESALVKKIEVYFIQIPGLAI